MFGDIVILIRPAHWIKNIFVLIPVIFSMQMKKSNAWIDVFPAFIAFCLISSSGYVLNDILDAESDRNHPSKQNRPITSGRITRFQGCILSLVLLVISLAVAYSCSYMVLYVIIGYAAMQVLYSLVLKHKVILDVIIISMGFVLRAVCGAVAIKVAVSPWLFICMFTLCLFMGFCKRYSEVVIIGDEVRAHGHRKTLISYSPDLLTHLITVSAGIAIISFLMYGLSPMTVEHFGTYYFVYTLPLVVYAIFRFAMLSMSGNYSDPTDLILHDVPFQLTAVLWLACTVAIVGWGRSIQHYMGNFY